MKPEVLNHWMYKDNMPSVGFVVYDSTGRYNYEITFLRLDNFSGNRGCENSLREGRFHCYTRDKQEHVVRLTRKNNSEEQLHNWFSVILEWIACNIEDKWSLDIDIEDIHTIDFYFGFSDVAVAVMFKLLFS